MTARVPIYHKTEFILLLITIRNEFQISNIKAFPSHLALEIIDNRRRYTLWVFKEIPDKRHIISRWKKAFKS